jgi:hypothetical protein
MASVFKALVTRMVKSAKELKTQENMVRVIIYCCVFFFVHTVPLFCCELYGD